MPIPAEIPISKHFTSKETRNEIDEYLKDRLDGLVRGLSTIREVKITQWRKIYSGTPKEKTKSFPWQNASNVVPQIVGSFVDQLTAKIIMGTMIDPLWVVNLAGEFNRRDKAEEQREAVERWLAYAGLESSQLNLLSKYVIWVRTMVKYGLGAMKLIPELTVEQVAQRVDSEGKVAFVNHTRKDGPTALPLVFEDFLIPPMVQELERAPIVSQRRRMQRFEVEQMKYDSSFDQKAIEKILKTPDRNGPDKTEQDIEQDTGVKSGQDGKESQRWDMYEAYFPYYVAGNRFHLIATYHLGTKTMAKCVFNWLPENEIPYRIALLGSDGERSYGFGFCEMLKDYQEEIAAIHNRRGDASTLSNTNLLRIGGGLQLDSQFSIYPNATISGEQGAIEVIPLGRNANETIKDENMTLQLAQDRAGVGPSSSGQGSGTVNKKGSYSAMGAFPVMQEGNTRANLNLTEFRQSHYSLGRLATLYYANYGVNPKDVLALGKEGKYLDKALESYKAGKIILPIRAATGSVNKEIEKQNLMLLLNNMRAHWQMVSQLLQGLQNPMLGPAGQEYAMQIVLASNMLMKKITREFGINDPTQYLPEPTGLKEQAEKAQQALETQAAQAGAQPGAQPPNPAQQPPPTPVQ